MILPSWFLFYLTYNVDRFWDIHVKIYFVDRGPTAAFFARFFVILFYVHIEDLMASTNFEIRMRRYFMHTWQRHLHSASRTTYWSASWFSSEFVLKLGDHDSAFNILFNVFIVVFQHFFVLWLWLNPRNGDII
jgi:hypothetical protein